MDVIEVVHGEQELFERAGHLFATATEELSCAANTLYTWVATRPGASSGPRPRVIRKLFRLSAMLDPTWAQHAHVMAAQGASVRVGTEDLNETILLDRRVAILASDVAQGLRTFSVITSPQVVQGVSALFEAAWNAASDLAVHDATMVDLRPLAPRILTALNEGWTDETAARALGLSLRTYRRRVAELMSALGATSRFQAGARARELGLV
jgi:hypothetical protein